MSDLQLTAVIPPFREKQSVIFGADTIDRTELVRARECVNNTDSRIGHLEALRERILEIRVSTARSKATVKI